MHAKENFESMPKSVLRSVAQCFPLIAVLTCLVLLSSSPAATAATTSQSTREVFKTHCAMCHGADGLGTPLGKALHAPSLRSEKVLKQPNETLVQIVTKGKNNMPSFGNTFNKKQISNLVKYIRRLATTTSPQK